MIRIELHALEVYGYHGCEDFERRDGQPFLFDVELEIGDAALSDRLADTVDYTAVAAVVKRVSDERKCYLLEALAGSVADALIADLDETRASLGCAHERELGHQRVADALMAEFPLVGAAKVRARKPQVVIPGFTVAYSAAAVERRR